MTVCETGSFLTEAPKRTPDTFDDLPLSQPLLKAVAAAGYEAPTPIQRQAIPHVLAGRDVLGCAQTGTGKTAAFALPILHRLSASPAPSGGRRRPRALVLSPTRELAVQIDDSFRDYGRFLRLRSTTIYGGVSQSPQTQALQRGVDIVVATPGRLLDLMQQGWIDLGGIETLVIDEADRLLDMGFIHDVRRIVGAAPRERQTLLFSATMPAAIRELADAVMSDPIRVQVAAPAARADGIEQTVYFVPQACKSGLLRQLLDEKEVTRALVFTRTKHGADRLARQLARAGVRAEAIHGDKNQNARQRAITNFRTLATPVLVATDLAARGLDIDGVSHVVNFDLPMEPETYVHRIGRTARAGATGVAFTLCDHDERARLFAIEQLLREPLPVMRDGVRVVPDPQPEPEEAVAAPRRTSPQVVYRTRRRR